MPATVLSAATLGIDAYPVHVEVDTDRQLPSFTVVGLPDGAVRESRERVMEPDPDRSKLYEELYREYADRYGLDG